MALIRMFFKLLALPLMLAVTIIQWVGIFFTSIGFVFGVTAGAEAGKMLAVAFVVFVIPHIAEWLIVRIAALNYGLRNFIKS